MFQSVSRNISLLLLTFSLLLVGCSEEASKSASSSLDKKTIAVIGHGDFLPDQVDTGQGTIGVPDDLAAKIMEHLSTSQRFSVVERTALRKVVMEQRFGNVRKSYMDRTLENAIGDMDDVNPRTLAIAGFFSSENDMQKDFQNLGQTVGADYLVFATIEKLEAKQVSRQLPYSNAGFTVSQNTVDARLRLRIIDGKKGVLVGATSIRSKFSEDVFSSASNDSDAYTVYDNIGRIAAARVLDLTFPAHIASTEPLVLTRGSNDGAKVGDIYNVVREGEEVRDKSGVIIGRMRNSVGTIRVASTQPTLSIVEPVGNISIVKNDVALLDIADDAGSTKPVRSGAVLGAAGKKGKATIVVGKLTINKGFANGSLSANHVEKMSNDLIVQFGNTRRFDVMERSQIDQILDEKTFESIVHGGDMSHRLNELKGADYIIHGEISDFRIVSKSENVPLVNEVMTTNSAVATGTVRIVDVHSGKIIAADKVRIDAEQKDIEDSNIAPLVHLMEAFTTRITALVVERLYPIKVIGSAGDGLVYINRGLDGGLKEGDSFSLLKPGQAMIDPDTGISFGSADVKTGELTITSVENSRAIARLVSGGPANNGSILKMKNKQAKAIKLVEPVNQPKW